MNDEEKIEELLHKCERGEIRSSEVVADVLEANWAMVDADDRESYVSWEIEMLMRKGFLDYGAVKEFVKNSLRAHAEKHAGSVEGYRTLEYYADEIARIEAVAEVAKKYGIGAVKTEWRGTAPRTNGARRA